MPCASPARRCLFAIAGALLSGLAAAQDEPLRPGRLSVQERDALRPGLKGEFFAAADEQQAGDACDLRLAALHVAKAQPATPFLEPGPFRAVLTGYLKLPLRGEYHFSLKGSGAAKLSLNDQLVLEVPQGDLAKAAPAKAELVKGYNKLRLEFASPAGQDASLRLFWASGEFAAEPVSPLLLWHDGRDAALRAGNALRQGRMLFAQRHCAKCHPLPATAAARPGPGGLTMALAMPELRRDAPSLAGAGQRLDEKWMARWILDPGALRSEATMPRVLAHLDGKAARQQAADIAAFLAAQQEADFRPLPAPRGGERQIAQGEMLFEQRGCIACHRMTAVADEDNFRRLSLEFVGTKFRPGALAAFLADSHRHYRWSPMPRFALEEEEAQALAAYLLSHAKGVAADLEGIEAPSAERGRKLLATAGCSRCHQVDAKQPLAGADQGLKLRTLEQGCLAAAPHARGKAPRHPLDDDQRGALVEFLKGGLASLDRETPAEFSRRQFQANRCRACHSRDTLEADLPYVLVEHGELGLTPEPIPDLTWAGEKLRADWMARQFAGELKYRPRPHFHARMPAFPAQAQLLAAGLSAEHGLAARGDLRPQPRDDLARIGAEVAAMDAGLACHRCHAVADKEAEAPFEARSTNLSFASERLRYEFYHRWMRDPLRIDPQTKMIKFAQDGRRTGLTTIYEGDARQQFEAVWHYLCRLGMQHAQGE